MDSWLDALKIIGAVCIATLLTYGITAIVLSGFQFAAKASQTKRPRKAKG